MSYLKPQLTCSLNFASLFNVMSDKSSVIFWLKLYMILQKEPTKVLNFRLSTTQWNFTKFVLWYGSFSWRYIKLQLKRYRWVVSHDTEEWWKIWRFFVSKMTRIWWILIRALKSLKKLHFDWSLLCKVYNVWPKKVQRSVFHHTETLKSHAKFEEKLTCGLENDMRNLANFHQNTWKCQNWYFHGILLSKVENVWAKNLQRSYV